MSDGKSIFSRKTSTGIGWHLKKKSILEVYSILSLALTMKIYDTVISHAYLEPPK